MTNESDGVRPLKAFLIYATEDRELVEPYYDFLKENGADPWMDCHRILPGSDWNLEQDKALESADVVIVFVSILSNEKRGQCQREILLALEHHQKRLPLDTYLIPLCLDDAELPERLKRFQATRVADSGHRGQLLAALQKAAQERKVRFAGFQAGPFVIRTRFIRNAQPWKGCELDVAVPELESDVLTDECSELNPALQGMALAELHAWRLGRGTDSGGQTSVFECRFAVAAATSEVISVLYSYSYYVTGAAHPDWFFRAANYHVKPVFPIDMRELVQRRDLDRLCRAGVAQQVLSESDKRHRDPDTDVDLGTAGVHTLEPNGLRVHFDRYLGRVVGTQAVTVPYAQLIPLLGPGSFVLTAIRSVARTVRDG